MNMFERSSQRVCEQDASCYGTFNIGSRTGRCTAEVRCFKNQVTSPTGCFSGNVEYRFSCNDEYRRQPFVLPSDGIAAVFAREAEGRTNISAAEKGSNIWPVRQTFLFDNYQHQYIIIQVLETSLMVNTAQIQLYKEGIFFIRTSISLAWLGGWLEKQAF